MILSASMLYHVVAECSTLIVSVHHPCEHSSLLCSYIARPIAAPIIRTVKRPWFAICKPNTMSDHQIFLQVRDPSLSTLQYPARRSLETVDSHSGTVLNTATSTHCHDRPYPNDRSITEIGTQMPIPSPDVRKHQKAPTPPAVSTVESLKAIICASFLNVLIVFVFLSWALYFTYKSLSAFPPVLVLSTLSIAIVPLARLLSFATESLCENIGHEAAGFFNALIGNLVQLVVSIVALVHCDIRFIQSTVVGTILVNLLLIFGIFIIECAMKNHKSIEQQFGISPSDINTSLVILSVQGMLIPTAFVLLTGGDFSPNDTTLKFSRVIAVVFLVVFLGNLLFHVHRMRTNKRGDIQDTQNLPVSSAPGVRSATRTGVQAKMNRPVSCCLFLVCTSLLIFTSKFLVDMIERVTNADESAPMLFGIIIPQSLKEFFGLVIIPLISSSGRCFDHIRDHFHKESSDKSKLVFEISTTFGSSIQMTLFVMPLLVVIAWFMNKPMSMVLDPFEAFSLFLTAKGSVTVLLVNSVVQDNKSNWLEGVMLLCNYSNLRLYVIFAALFWFYPAYVTGKYLVSCMKSH
ncbi:hypothetical protein AMATHDRAFT_84057 [Amanita thiersii Skay4041]|uniref:Sodium/calcium exchanger membrane region domain-containing protein n=1 Tax=Amanita thiersii Skay4041 TaxID=703135 RepID=A0A2A9NPZ3_9AGAR|nr:hypothetical protein AMATHDRAFT_84057 [Amanita thiersii Skay4041]